MSTFSENSKVQSDHPEPTSGGLNQPHSIASSDGVLAGNVPALAKEETSTPIAQSVTASMGGQNILPADAGNTKAVPNPADRNQNTEATIVDDAASSKEMATSQLKVQISQSKAAYQSGFDIGDSKVRTDADARSHAGKNWKNLGFCGGVGSVRP